MVLYHKLKMTFFRNLESQYIDENGKTRMLNYSSNISLVVDPIPPLNLPTSNIIHTVTKKEAIDFANGYGLKVVSQDKEEDKTVGIWVEERTSNIKGYIPTDPIQPLKNVGIAPTSEKDPIRVENISRLEEMQTNRKIADYLKQYTLYEYSKDPENFGEDNFVVVPDHEYDISSIGNQLVPNNKVMYQNKKLITLSYDMTSRLLSFLEVKLVNDRSEVLEYKDRVVLKDYFRTLSDFRSTPEQYIFLTKESMLRWRDEKYSRNNEQIVSYFIRDTVEPYIFRHPKFIKGKISIIQNVKDGDLDLCLEVGEKWAKDKVNIGYHPTKKLASERVHYTVYSEDGSTEIVSGDGEKVYVIEYFDGEFAAILPL